MITEEQARTLLAGEPASRIDAAALLGRARRVRRRRQAVAAGVAAVALAGPAVVLATSSGGGRASVTPIASEPAARPGAPAWVVLGTFADRAGRRQQLAAEFRDEPTSPDGVRLCLGVVRGSSVDDYGGCHTDVLPPFGKHVGASGFSPGAVENGPDSTFGVMGQGWSATVVSNEVETGALMDLDGDLHEGTVHRAPGLPARLLVVHMPGEWMNGFVVRDADGRVLERSGPWPRYGTPPP
ncbi:MAG TPA: hypothetical protein VNA20_03420 [Frankiaceae bacterium]|nr:hypothetical protein [Frankiaceae bacterium]